MLSLPRISLAADSSILFFLDVNLPRFSFSSLVVLPRSVLAHAWGRKRLGMRSRRLGRLLGVMAWR